MPVWWVVALLRRFMRSYVINCWANISWRRMRKSMKYFRGSLTLTKSTLSQIFGACSGVKAIKSPSFPGTAMERSFSGPIAFLISSKRSGKVSISETFSEFGIFL